jgi:hypothetical protein
MKRNLSYVAIMALLFSSLAFAGDKDKSTSTAGDAQPASAAGSENTAQSNDNPCVSAGDKADKKKDKNKAKPAPSDQEEQFNKVLMGIYG